MKKIVALILALSIAFALCACGNRQSNTAPIVEPTTEPTEEPVGETRKEIKIGETIKTPNYELTLDAVAIGPTSAAESHVKELHLCMLCDYSAFIIVTVKNLQKESFEISEHKWSYVLAKIDYNNGFIYEPIEGYGTNSKGQFEWVSEEVLPLEKGRAAWQIEVAEDVYTNRENPLYAVFIMGDGEEYYYQFTESDYVK